MLVLAACGGGGDGSADGAASDTWCATAQQIEDSSERYDAAFDDGGQSLGEALGEFTSLLNDAKGSAPSEISEAVETAADGIAQFDELLGDVDYDVFELDESDFAELEEMGDEMDAATDKIEAYNLKECGIGSADGSSDEPAEPDDQAAEPAVVDDDMAEDEAIIDEVVPDDDMADADDVTFSGDSNSQWCVANRELDVVSDEFNDLFLAEPEALEAKLTEMLGLVEAAASIVPPELAGDVALSLTAMRQLETALIAADYDILNADLSVLDEDAAGQVANDNIEAYNEQVCGIIDDDDDSTDDDDDDGFQAGAGTIRDQAVAELVDSGFTQPEAECVFDNIDFADPELGNDPNAMFTVFDDCGIDLTRLSELGE